MALLSLLKEASLSDRSKNLNYQNRLTEMRDLPVSVYRWMSYQMGVRSNEGYRPFYLEIAGKMRPIEDPSKDNFENLEHNLKLFFKQYFLPSDIEFDMYQDLSSFLYFIVFKSFLEKPQDWLTLDREGTPRVGRPPMTFHLKKGISGTMLKKYTDDMVKSEQTYLDDDDKEEFFRARQTSYS